jgi:anthranilate/para-aminobenzoate synthase component I
VDQVEEIRELIREGSVYQVNLTQRFRIPCDEDPLIVYRRMRSKHPAPYSAFIPIGESAILSSSPECFLRSDGMHVESRPIKGTIRRSRDADQDADLQGQLRDSEKDLAELTMIVDLVRNDLSRVCRGGSIRVEEHAHIESAPTVHHLVTSVKGELEVGRDGFDLLRAALPAGSITGAPKVRAMELIDNLERVRRGVYTGSIGFIAPDASMDLSVAIRTVVLSNRVAHVFGGGGIVIDSLPESEYDESLVKVRGLIDLLGGGFTS